MYYNPLRVINGEFSQQVGLARHLMPHHISPLKNNSGKCIFFQISSTATENKDVVPANLHFCL
jgi:hypothetical protein